MITFRVIFSDNNIVSCNVTAYPLPEGKTTHYELHNGKLLYALILAESTEAAIATASNIIDKIKASPKHKRV